MSDLSVLPMPTGRDDGLPPVEVEPPEQVPIWGLPLARLDYRAVVDHVDRLIAARKPAFFITANLHYAMLTDRDRRLAEVNRRAALLVADGMPMVWYSRIVGRPLPERVAGSDLIGSLCQLAAERGYPVFFLGGAPGVAEAAVAELRRSSPALRVAGVEGPQMECLSAAEEAALIDRIARSGARLLFAALGQPKGELWLAERYGALGGMVSVQVGASLDFLAGRARRAPQWIQRIGMEWAHRLACDPRRLGPRYFRNAVFLVKAVWRDVFGH